MACVCLTYVVLMVLPHFRSEVTKANFNRIQDGMEWEEVKEILGQDSGFMPGRPWDFVAVWERDDGAATFVTFRHGKVAGKEWRSAGTIQGFFDSFIR